MKPQDYRNLYDDLPKNVMIDNYAAFQEIYGDQFGDDLLNWPETALHTVLLLLLPLSTFLRCPIN